MPQYGKRTIQCPLTADEVATLVRQLGDQIAEGTIRLAGKEIDLEGYESIGIGFKQAGQGLRMRVKVKFPRRPGEEGDDDHDNEDD